MNTDNQRTPQAQQEGVGTDGAQLPRAEVNPAQDTEFRLTIKKLELPVRPRGVLAE